MGHHRLRPNTHFHPRIALYPLVHQEKLRQQCGRNQEPNLQFILHRIFRESYRQRAVFCHVVACSTSAQRWHRTELSR